ncbi:MAG: hypothetical protein JWQ38_2899 [Flavipsychrobacter sp.]|nr:hypothetical protein [Flavipsychrobacter sp.]
MGHVYNKIRLVIIAVVCGLIWQSCKVIDPKERTPTYFHIDSFVFNTCLPGLNTLHKITAVAVFYNNAPVGFFDLPANVPILANATGQMSVAPAIFINGLSSLTSVYPFYQFDTSTITSQPGKVVTYLPKTCYYPTTKVKYISRFDGAPGFVRVAGNKDLLTTTNPDLEFEGGTGIITLSALGDSSVNSTNTTFPIPSGSAFIEITYKSTIPFYIGLQAKLGSVVSSEPYYLAGINPSSTWTKFYLNVADFHGQYQGTDYNFYLKAVLADGQTSGQLLIDNIQLVTF